MNTSGRYRWTVVAVFFAFMLLHQSDKLLIGPLTTPIMETFGIGETKMGFVFSGALLVGFLMYPLWGYLYDRYARARLLAVASLIWGSTTWLSAIAPTYGAFLVTRATTGIDDSSYPGLYSLISDYFGPQMRGKVYGLLQLSQPLGYMVGLLAATMLAATIGWRSIFYITGSLGLVLAVLIFLFVKEAPRGQSEPELQGIEVTGTYRFDWEEVKGLFKKRSLRLLFVQGFVGIFPWQVITFWIFRYLEVERGYSADAVLLTMAPAVLVLALGYFVGGAAGDFFFKRTPRGRMLVSMVAVLLGGVLLFLAIRTPVADQGGFLALLIATALFIPFASPNVISTVHDITLPEVRSTALSVQYFIENSGAVVAPTLAGIVAERASLGDAILWICVSAWIVGAVFLAFTAYYVPEDIAALRQQMAARAEIERGRQEPAPLAA